MAAEVPGHAEGAGHPQGGVAVAVGAAEEGQSGADVGLLVTQQPQRLPLLMTAQRDLGVLDVLGHRESFVER